MSESTTSSNSCPKCGAVLPSDATAGLCPRCLMAEAMAPTQVDAEPAAARQTLAPAELAPFFPQLEILECLGRGGMGVVYKARQKSLNRFVALKLLAPERVRDTQFAERFTREAQALAALSHPNIVTIYDFGQAGGFYFLLMEFVDGLNLRQLLRMRKFTPEEALAIVPPLCDALQLAHDRGIVHRDIKPENLLLDKDGRVKVADFGIAKMLGAVDAAGKGGGASAPGSTTQTAVGTPGYSAPEQKTDPQRVDSRADIYSLGVVFYEMLTGELPGKRIEPPSSRMGGIQIDVRLDEIVLRALEREPERRYQTAGELKTVIETVVAETLKHGGTGSFAPGTGPRGTAVLSAPRWSRTAIAGTVGIGFFLVVILLWLMDWPASSDPSFGHTLPQILFRGAVLPAGLVAVLVGTILGWIAVARIRRSAGRIRGLRLAAFEGLFLPLLTVDFFILLVWAFAVKALAAHRGLGGSMFRNLWDFAAFTLLLGLVAGWVDYLIIRPIWRAITGSAGGGVPGSSAHTQRNLRWLAVALGLAVIILYPGYVTLTENSRKARYGWGVEDGIELNYQVFEADAALVDQRVPFDVREPGNALSSAGTYTLAPSYTAVAQMAEIDDAILSALQQSATTNFGVLVNATRKGESLYQWRSDAWSYKTDQASGKGQGFCGMGRDRQSVRFRIRYQVSHIVGGNARHPVTAEISYEGPTPPGGKARAFFIPFGRDQQAKYLVIVFAAKAASKDTASEPSPAGPVELKWKWPPVGERVVFDMEMKRNGEHLTPGQPDSQKEYTTVEKKFGLTVLKATPGGGHEVELEFLSIRYRIALGGETVLDYDSTQKSPAPGTNSLTDIYGKLVGSKIRYFLNASNGVERMEGVDELEKRLSSGASAEASALTKLQFGEGYLKQMISGLDRCLPPKAVQPGDTWPVQMEMAMSPFGTVSRNYTVTFQNWEQHWNRNCARLEVQSTVKTKPDPNSNPAGTSASNFEGTSSGVSWFDPELGMIIETTANDDMKMVINPMPASSSGNPGASGPTPGTIYQWHDAVNTTVLQNYVLEGLIGVELRVDRENIIIQEIVPGLPAAAQKDIHVGDRIIAVAQDTGPAVPVHGGQLAQAVALIHGPAGTTVRLTLVSSGEDDSHARVVSFVRAGLKAPPR
jgi:tRNA A-37 threonylcarbamoyl transferase component Bud32